MLIIGIWAIVVILLIVHWDKIHAVIGGLLKGVLGLAVFVGGVALLWWGGSWVWDHRAETKTFLIVTVAICGAVYAVVMCLLSLPHILKVARNVGWREAFKIVFDRWIFRALLIMFMLLSSVPLISRTRDDIMVVIVLWGIAIVGVTLYAHGRLCQRFHSDCKILPYLTDQKNSIKS